MLTEAGARVSRHESAHVGAAAVLGWPLRGVERGHDFSGLTHLTPRKDGDIKERGTELGVILLVAVMEDARGGSADWNGINELVQSGVPLSSIWDRASAMRSDPEYLRKKAAVERALHVKLSLTKEELAEVLDGAA